MPGCPPADFFRGMGARLVLGRGGGNPMENCEWGKNVKAVLIFWRGDNEVLRKQLQDRKSVV